MVFGGTANEAEGAVDEMVEAIAQQIFRTPMEERKQAMEAIGRSLVEVFNAAEASSAGDSPSDPGNGAALLAALNLRISTRVIELDSAFDESRAVVSGSLIVPDDRARPVRSNLEFALDRWPHPAWPEASALLGDTAAFVASFPLPAPGSAWDLQNVTVSLSLFTLTGTGQVRWGEKPSVSLELAGKLSCAQLRGNLPASMYLEQVKKYLEPEPALTPAAAAVRLREEVELRLSVSLDRAFDGKREAAWHLDAGCGLAMSQ
jgi:hypothetical protein